MLQGLKINNYFSIFVQGNSAKSDPSCKRILIIKKKKKRFLVH
jgi:hypothetical protein